MMVAAAKYRMEAKPDIVVLQDVRFTPAEMQDVAAVVGKDLFTDELRETLGQFEQAKNFGSGRWEHSGAARVPGRDC